MNPKIVLASFGIEEAALLGEGVEAWVYALDDDRVLRISKNADNSTQDDLVVVESLLAAAKLPFDVPQTYSTGEINGVPFSIKKRFHGEVMSGLLPKIDDTEKRTVIKNYLLSSEKLRHVDASGLLFGTLIGDTKIQSVSWVEYLIAGIDKAIGSSPWVRDDVQNFDAVHAKVIKQLAALGEPEKHLVHGDFYPPNVYVDDDLSISAVGDFGGLCVVGDYQMDVACAYFSIDDPRTIGEENISFIKHVASEHYGEHIHEVISAYKAYYAMIFSANKKVDKQAYGWAVKTLNQLALST